MPLVTPNLPFQIDGQSFEFVGLGNKEFEKVTNLEWFGVYNGK